MSLICEEFGCTPSQALRELEGDDGLIFDVLDLRGYARTKALVDAAKSEGDVPQSKMVDWVFAVQADLFKRRRNRE